MRTKVIIFLIIIITALLRIYSIEQKNLWFDEIYSWKISQGSNVEIISETSGDIHPPLFYIVLKIWIQLFSDSIFSMRMLSVLFSIVSIYFIFKLSRLFLKNNLQVISVLLLYALSPLNIYYSQEVRMLNLNLFLCLGSVYYFCKFSNYPSLKYGLTYIIFSILALYTHYFAFFILFTEVSLILIFYFFQKEKLVVIRKYFLCFTVINMLYVPWYPVFLSQILKGQPWRTEQSIIQITVNVFNYFKEIFLSSYIPFESVKVYYLSLFVGFFLTAFLIYSLFKIINKKRFFSERTYSIALFFFIPLFIASVISLNQSIVLSRYLSIILPFLFITIVYFSFEIYKTKTAYLINTIFILLSCYGTFIYFKNDFKNNDYREIISYIETNYHEGDGIIAEPHFMGWSMNYYLKHNQSVMKPPKAFGWNMNMQIDSLQKSKDMNKIWLILDFSSLEKDKYETLPQLMKNIGYHISTGKSFYISPCKVSVGYYIRDSQH